MKKSTTIILTTLITLILGGVAIFTATRLYQLRNQPVAPNVPSSIPLAAETYPACNLSFTFSVGQTPTPTPTATPTVTPTPTDSTTAPTPTITPTGTPNSCNGTCGSNTNCGDGLFCYQGFCRNPSCASESDCDCSTGPTPTPTTPTLPQSGTNWPTLLGVGVGIVTIIGSLILAL